MKEYRRKIVHHVYGIVFKDADQIVSGDERIGIHLPIHSSNDVQTKTLRFVRYAPPTQGELPRGASVSVRQLHSPTQSDDVQATIKFDEAASSPSTGYAEGTLTLSYRQMHSNYMGVVEIEDESVEVDGESFETAIFVSAESISA